MVAKASSTEVTPDSRRDDGTKQARGITINFLTLLAQAAFPAFHVQLARLLGAENYGVYAWSNACVEMFSLLTMFGMDRALIRQVSLAVARNDLNAAATATGTALRTVILSGFLIAATLFGLAPTIARWQNNEALCTPLRILAFEPIAYHVTSIFVVATQSKQIMKYGFWIRGIFQPLILLAFTTVALRVNGDLQIVCASAVIALFVTSVAAAMLYRRVYPLKQTLAIMLRGPVDTRLIRTAFPFLLANFAWAMQGRLATFFLGHYRGSVETGVYTACALYAIAVAQVRDAFEPVACALIPAALLEGRVASLNATLKRQTRWIAIIAAPICVLFAGFGDVLLQVFGPAFVSGTLAMAVLSAGHFINAISLATFALTMSGNSTYVTLCAFVSVVIQAVLIPLFISRYGIVGAAVSTAGGIVIGQSLQMIFTYRLTKVMGLSLRLLPIIAVAGVALVVGRVFLNIVQGPIIVRFLAGVAIAAVTYIIGTTAISLNFRERRLAVEFIRGVVSTKLGWLRKTFNRA